MRKKLGLLLVMFLCLSLVPFPASGNLTDTLVSDVIDINGHWAKDQMQRLVGMGVVKGYPTTVYDPRLGMSVPAKKLRPDQKITRAEFAVMMFETLNLAPVDTASPFKDYSKIPSWARTAINTLYEKGIMLGNKGYVNPNANIKRAEIAAMVVKGLHDQSVVSQPKDFPDLAESHWAYAPVQKAADMGIILGKSNGSFAPNSYATRAEVMVMLYNMLSKDKTQSPEDEVIMAVADDYMDKNKAIINGAAPYDLTGLAPLLTGHEKAASTVNSDLLNQMKEDYPEMSYEILSSGTINSKSDWLAEITYETKFVLKGTQGEEVLNMTEHIRMMKIGSQWLIYHVPSELS